MSIHKEVHFEAEICERLAALGWLYEADSAARHDRTLALFPEDLEAWVKTSQPEAWAALQSSHGAHTTKVLSERLRKALDGQGALEVLRHGFDVIGLKHPIALCQFKPALAMNADLQARYAANIAQRVQIVVEHFRKHVAPLLKGHAKAMVVTGSRKEAVRWQKAIAKYIGDHGYKIETLVAFSGEVIDPESGPDPFTEHSKELNPRLKGQDIRTAFKGPEYSILLVANKFQTGFDEPLLTAMYVDKRLGGIQAVQTLSRLNRCHPGKDQTFVVDFVNDPAEILASFKPYHETAELADVTDPYTVNELRAKLDAQALYDTFEVDRVVVVALKGSHAKQSELDAALTPVAERVLDSFHKAKKAREAAGDDAKAAKQAKDEMDALVLFKGDIGAYVRLYGFLSQIFDYGNTDIEKRAIFFKLLHPLLTLGREREGVDLSALRLTAYTIKDMGSPKLNLGVGEPVPIYATSETGSGQVQDKQKVLLQELIARVNDLFEGDLSPGDKLVYVNNAIRGKLLESEVLIEQAQSNSKEQFANSPDLAKEMLNAIMDALTAHGTMSKQALDSPKLRGEMQEVLLGPGQLYEALRERGASSPDQRA